jgi:hypothetical protein
MEAKFRSVRIMTLKIELKHFRHSLKQLLFSSVRGVRASLIPELRGQAERERHYFDLKLD